MTLKVLSVPTGHVYVRHLRWPGVDDDVLRLPDPPVPGDAPAAQWWPPPSLDPAWIATHHDEFDLAHLHFGFDARSPTELSEWTRVLRAHAKPFVYTVHDLRNPHHRDTRLHDAQLDALVPTADALVTLTPGAATAVQERWGRRPVVVPHPHVVEEPALSRPRPAREGFTVGLHLKSLRAGMEPVPVLETLAGVVPDLQDGRLRVDVHTDVMTPGTRNHDPQVVQLLHRLQRAGRVDLRVHDYFTDDELWDYLQSLDVSVLPYRFGTHSGWLEACHDLGTTVVAPTCGFYAEQRPCLTYRLDEHGLDPLSLTAAVTRAYEERPSWRADPQGRRTERAHVAQAHRSLYRDLRPG